MKKLTLFHLILCIISPTKIEIRSLGVPWDALEPQKEPPIAAPAATTAAKLHCE